MLLSALAFAAALQAAPEIVLKGYLPDRHTSVPQAVDQLVQPPSRKARAVMGKAASEPWQFSIPPRGVRGKLLRAPKKEFVVNPQMASCKTAAQLAGKPETLTVQPLSKMPKAHGERAVARLVDGCPVAVLIAQADPLH